MKWFVAYDSVIFLPVVCGIRLDLLYCFLMLLVSRPIHSALSVQEPCADTSPHNCVKVRYVEKGQFHCISDLPPEVVCVKRASAVSEGAVEFYITLQRKKKPA